MWLLVQTGYAKLVVTCYNEADNISPAELFCWILTATGLLKYGNPAGKITQLLVGILTHSGEKTAENAKYILLLELGPEICWEVSSYGFKVFYQGPTT